MNAEQIQSPAFEKAELRSERLRILGVSAFVAVFALLTVARVFVVRTAAVNRQSISGILLAALILVYELGMLRTVNAALVANVNVPGFFWILSTVVETSIPAFALAFLTAPQIELTYRPLASPAILVFFIFIVLSTLRLSFWMGALSGSLSSVLYVAAAVYLGWRPPTAGVPAPVTQTAVTLNAITLLTGGIIAGVVAMQIRKHVLAALREAETRRKLDAIQHDLQVARSIQQSLLPQENPRLAGFEIAGWNLPADDTGGDYFDWKVLPNGKVMVSLADVTGHGIGPALLASACHAYAKSIFASAPDLPSALERINQEVSADLAPGRFVTFVAAVCWPGRSEIEMLSAGHGPIFIYHRPEDRFVEMNAQALPLGILPSLSSDPPARLQLEAGSLILLATDGFFEWENERGEQFGIERMEEAIRRSRDATPAGIIKNLYEAVLAFAEGTKQQDDLTAVIIKRL